MKLNKIKMFFFTTIAPERPSFVHQAFCVYIDIEVSPKICLHSIIREFPYTTYETWFEGRTHLQAFCREYNIIWITIVTWIAIIAKSHSFNCFVNQTQQVRRLRKYKARNIGYIIRYVIRLYHQFCYQLFAYSSWIPYWHSDCDWLALSRRLRYWN